jgi:hypothetical protein
MGSQVYYVVGVAKLRCRKGLAILGAKLLASRRMKRSEALFTQHDVEPPTFAGCEINLP